MKKLLLRLTPLLILIAIIGFLANILYYPTVTEKYAKDKEVFVLISEEMFKSFDEGTVEVGETWGLQEPAPNEEITKLLKRAEKKCDVYYVRLVDEDVVLFSNGGFTLSVEGIIKTRNDPELKKDWGNTGFDGAMDYSKIDDNTYTFWDGL